MPLIGRFIAALVAGFLLGPAVWAEEIHDAVKKGDLPGVQALLTAKPDRIRAVDERGYTPLHIAAREGRMEIASLLVEKGADLEAKNTTGYTPLFLAVAGKRSDVVRFLLEKGANANAETRFQTTPVFNAAESGNVEVLRAIIERKADINHISPAFGSPLHRAAYMDFPEAAKILLDAGADLKVKDQRGQTPLHQAAQLGRTAVAKLFVERGAEIDARDRGGLTPLHLAILYGTDRAGSNNSVELGFLFLDHGARIDTAGVDGDTPLWRAAMRGYTSLVEAFLRRGADLQMREPGTKRTLLHLAAIRGFSDLVELLLSRGLDAAAVDDYGRQAVDYAVEHGHGTVVLRLAVPKKEYQPVIGGMLLAKPLAGGEAYVWAMNHRGWTVKTKSRLFVFDNEELGRKPDWPSLSNGWISGPEIGGQDVIALYSAYHAEPNTVEFIHKLENRLDRIAFVHYKDDPWKGSGPKSVYVKGRETQKFGPVEVIPYETHDEGNMGSLGYLIKVDDLKIFYPNFFPEDIESFKKEIDFLAGQAKSCDIAFVEVTPGQENAYAAYIVEKLNPKLVIPYDRSGNTETGRELAAELGRQYPKLEFGLVRDAGDRLHYDRGKSAR